MGPRLLSKKKAHLSKLTRSRSAQPISLVVNTQEVIDDCATFPGHDAGVGILKGRHATVIIDFQEMGTLNAIWSVTELL